MWTNERGRAIANLPESLRLCSKCLMLFNDPKEAEFHAANCQPKFINKQPLSANLSVIHITSDSPFFERRICERIAKISCMVCKWDAPAVLSNKWITSRIVSEAFLLLNRSKIVSYIAIHHQKVGLETELLIADTFTVHSCRRKGNMKLLYREVLRNFGLKWIEFQEPFSPAGFCFIEYIQTAGLRDED